MGRIKSIHASNVSPDHSLPLNTQGILGNPQSTLQVVGVGKLVSGNAGFDAQSLLGLKSHDGLEMGVRKNEILAPPDPNYCATR
jgi:hypothetical protein